MKKRRPPPPAHRQPGQAPTHVFAWGNNEKRRALKGLPCWRLCSGTMGSCLIEFEDGSREIVSRRALRKVPRPDQVVE